MNHNLRAFLIVLFSTMTVLAAGCASQPAAPSPASIKPVTIYITGTPDSYFSGFYVANGVRSKLAGQVPATLEIPGISQIAITKKKPADELIVHAQTEQGGSTMTSRAGRTDGMLIVLQGGMSCSYISAEKLSSLADNSLIVIKPYWYAGTWVFDDDQVGLHREPFVQGIPEMIDAIVKDIPNAKQGFRLTCSEQPFPGCQKKLIWVRAENGCNYYRLEKENKAGWLCPAMFRYFSHTPKVLYVKADAISE